MKKKADRFKNAAELRRQAEETARETEGESSLPLTVRSNDEVGQALHELRVHQIELEMQNEELRRSQQELDIARARYFDLYDLAPVGYCTLSEQGVILEANLTISTLLGVPRGTIVRQLLSKFILKEDWPIYFLRRKRLLKTGQPQAFELRVMKADGSFFWARLEASGGMTVGSFPVCRVMISDITESVRAKEIIIREGLRLDSIIRGTHAGTWEWDVQTGKTIFNERWAEIIGYTLKEISPVSIQTWEKFTHPDDLRISSELLGRNFRRELNYYECEARMKHKDGHWVWVLDRGKVTEWTQNGEPLWMFGTRMDITERKKVEAELIESKTKAEAATKAKSQFVSNMSHEIRTPLNGVIGFTELLIESNMNDYQKEFAGYIRSSAQSLLALVNDILDFSKIEAGKIDLHEESCSLSEICQSTLDTVRQLANQKGLDLKIELHPSIPQQVKVDTNRLRQVLLNLLSNAIKYTDSGEVVLSVSLATVSSGSLVELSETTKAGFLFTVRDTGIGISSEHQKQLFSEFYQVDNSSARKQKGTGLGLAIVRSILERMGSAIHVESQPGKGSEFSFTLMMQIAQSSRDVESMPTVSTEEAPFQEKTDIRRGLSPEIAAGQFRILIAEDDALSMNLICTVLSRLLPNATLIKAANGAEAVTLWKEFQPHLIFMDIQMSEKDGYEATREIRNLETGHHTPIIAQTASAEKEEEEKCLQGGMDGHISKPIIRQRLLEVLERWLKQGR